MDEAPLLEKLSDLFNQKPNWKLKELKEQTEQPDKHRKKVLGKIAVSVTRGKLRFTYQRSGDDLTFL